MTESVKIIISDTVRSKAPTLFIESRLIRDIHISFAAPDLEERKLEMIAQWANTTEAQLASNSVLNTYRDLQKQLDEDTQMIPAVEALLTRGIRKGRFPNVNSVVDASNLVSLKHLIPIGLFDFDKLHGEVELTLSISGDQFIPIGKNNLVTLAPGTPILKDAEGIFSAVGARDSQRTMISSGSRNILAFSWGIEGVDRALVSMVLDECAAEILRWNQNLPGT